MTILQLIQKPQLRGAEMFASQLSNELVKLGHTVWLVALFPGDSNLPVNANFIALNRPQHKRWIDIEGWKALAKLIQEHEVDIVQCNAGDTLKFAVLSQKIYRWNTPIIARNASMVSSYITNPLTRGLNRWLYRNTQAIASVSQQSALDLNKLFLETKPKTTVIPIGINFPVYEEVQWKTNVPEAFHLIHVGGFTFEKNHPGLLSIFEKLLQASKTPQSQDDQKQPHYLLHLFGDGPLKSQMEDVVKQKGLENRVIFYGFTSGVHNYIQKADILLLPSIIEGLPGVILEAFHAETPVIAYHVGGIAEVITHEKTGLLIPKGEEEAFVEAIQQLSDPILSQDIAKRAKELVVAQFDNQYIAQAFEQLYKQVQ
jgi:L-malate glycosyltransferase